MLEALWRESFQPPIRPELVSARMRWLYGENPEGTPTTFVVTVDDAPEIIACASYLPRAMLVDGERRRAGVLCDFAVAPRHRTAGAAIAVQRALAKSADAEGYRFLFGFPNDASVGVCKRVGYKTVGTTCSWVKPIRSGYKLKIERAPILEGPASLVLDAGITAFDTALRRIFASGYEGEILSEPDARFDRLWERARPHRGIAGERTTSYLTWRYARFTTQKHAFFAIKKRGSSEIEGYAVHSTGGERAVLQDLFAVDFEETVDALLLLLANVLREANVSALALPYLGPEAFGERLRRLGFFKRLGDRTMVVYCGPTMTEPEKREVLSPASWFIQDGELDI